MRFGKSEAVQKLVISINGLQVDVDCHHDITKPHSPFWLKDQARALQNLMLMQESVLLPEGEGDYWTGFRNKVLPAAGYALAVGDTAAKMVDSVIEKCKLCTSFREECGELVAALENLHNVLLLVIQGSACLNRYIHEVLVETQLYSSKAYAFVEKLCFEKVDSAVRLPAHRKVQTKFNEFANRFCNQKAKLSEEYKKSTNYGQLQFLSPSCKVRLSFGVTTYSVPTGKSLYQKKHALIPLAETEGNSAYKVELSYPARTWRSKQVAVSSKVEGFDRGYSQILQAERVKVKKGSWGWDEAQPDTVQITCQNVVVATVASRSGSLLTYKCKESQGKLMSPQPYRASIQIVGWSRMDPDLQRLSITGMKDGNNAVYYKCCVSGQGKEVLAIYRYHQAGGQYSDGLLHIVGRGNQPGLRHNCAYSEGRQTPLSIWNPAVSRRESKLPLKLTPNPED